MILMPMGDHKTFDFRNIFFQIGNIRNDKVDTEHVILRECQTTVHNHNAVFVFESCDVHSDLLKSTKRNNFPLRPLREAVRSCGFCTFFTAALPLFFCCGFCCCLYLKFFCFGFCFFVLFSAGFLSWLLYLLGLNLLSRGILSLCVVCALFSFILFSILNQAPP